MSAGLLVFLPVVIDMIFVVLFLFIVLSTLMYIIPRLILAIVPGSRRQGLTLGT